MVECNEVILLAKQGYKAIQIYFVDFNLSRADSRIVVFASVNLGYGGPRISWFHNSWSPLFRDYVLGTNFVKSPPFRDFEKKFQKKKKKSGFFFGIFLDFVFY